MEELSFSFPPLQILIETTVPPAMTMVLRVAVDLLEDSPVPSSSSIDAPAGTIGLVLPSSVTSSSECPTEVIVHLYICSIVRLFDHLKPAPAGNSVQEMLIEASQSGAQPKGLCPFAFQSSHNAK